MLVTLFVPAVVLLVPLYLTVLDLPIVAPRSSNTYWAVWLPAGASAFNVLIVKRFFDNLPREIFEAARIDGAGPVPAVLVGRAADVASRSSVSCPCSRCIATWKDYLWPLLVLPDPDVQPLSVRLPTLQRTTELDVFLAALAISTLIPIALFLVFQRMFLRGAGLSGAVKG